eukprot:2964736-Pleurochrysis_carterae.AAC.1
MTHTGQTEAKGGSPNYWPDFDRKSSLAYPIEKTSTVCILPMQRASIYDVSKFANLNRRGGARATKIMRLK